MQEQPPVAYRSPPVIETVTSLQFAPLPGFAAPHGGWFWNHYLKDMPEWRSATLEEAPRVDDEFEDFGSEPVFVRPALQLRPHGSSRTQIISNDGERMIQVQDSRFIYNWRKRAGNYPSFRTTRPEFNALLTRFGAFLSDAGFPVIRPNQWELTYINHIPRQQLWETVSEWSGILPGLYIPEAGPPSADPEFESLSGGWRFRLKGGRGRLHVNLRHGQTLEPTKTQILALQLTARGPIDLEKGITADEGFPLGHDAIVHTFDQITSHSAHTAWGKL